MKDENRLAEAVKQSSIVLENLEGSGRDASINELAHAIELLERTQTRLELGVEFLPAGGL